MWTRAFLCPHLRNWCWKAFSGMLLLSLLLLLFSSMMILIIGLTCPLTIHFKFITKCDGLLLLSATIKCDKYYKVQSAPPPPDKIPWEFYWESKTYKLRRSINDLYGEVRGEWEDCIRRRHIYLYFIFKEQRGNVSFFLSLNLSLCEDTNCVRRYLVKRPVLRVEKRWKEVMLWALALLSS